MPSKRNGGCPPSTEPEHGREPSGLDIRLRVGPAALSVAAFITAVLVRVNGG